MPRLSKKQQSIKAMMKVLTTLANLYIGGDLHSDEEDDVFDLAIVVALWLLCISRKRYSVLRTRRTRQVNMFAIDSSTATGPTLTIPPFLNFEEYVQKYRMRRASFQKMVGKIEGHNVFRRGRRGPAQEPPSHQLMVLLQRLGIEGSGASNPSLRNMNHIGRGTNEVYFRRAREALLSLSDEYIRWPDASERKAIASRIFDDHKVPNCVGIIDGTLHPLAFKPQCKDAADYSGRKHPFSLSTLVVCDHKRRIRYYCAGWPGTAHDNRVWKNCDLFKKKEEKFGSTEYLMGDSAYECSPIMVSAYKRLPGKQLTRSENQFNTVLARIRVVSEHTIGVWKGRWPWLRNIRNIITSDPASTKEILDTIQATVILHNFLIEENEEVEDEWLESNCDVQLDDDDEVNRDVSDLPGNERRRVLTALVDELY